MIPLQSRVLRGAVLAAFVLAASACRPVASDTAAVPRDAETAIPGVLADSAKAWNSGDLAGHVRPYADSATFMGRDGPIQGRDRVGETLARSFWQDGQPRQQLAFDRIVVRPLGDRHALTTGHFLLTGGGEPDRAGWFSLTFEKTASGWQIVHDHSS